MVVMTKTKNFPRSGDSKIYDADDNVLVEYMEGRQREFLAIAKDIATKRGEPVYFYGNGREMVEPAPRVDMGVTMSWLNDRKAGTIVKVSPSGSQLVVREDKAIRTDDNGMSQDQSYRFEPDPAGELRTFHRQGDGSYKSGSVRLTIGVRNAWHCYEY